MRAKATGGRELALEIADVHVRGGVERGYWLQGTIVLQAALDASHL